MFFLLERRDKNGVNTDITNTVVATDDTSQFDACAKRIMAHRSILGNVLARLLPIYQGMDPREVADLILPDIHIGTVPVDPGLTNKAIAGENGDRIVGFNTEDKEINEGEVRFDLIFYARIPNTPNAVNQIIINIELQKERPTAYPLINRAVYYACRAISSQKERDFKDRHYGEIKNTYSVWICMNEHENYICDYHLTKEQIMGSGNWMNSLDLLHVILIGITNELPERTAGNELHRLLSALYSDQITSSHVLKILNKEYNIPITEEIGEEVNVMCNLGEGIAERAEERGRLTATTEFVINMFRKNRTAEEIADNLNLSLDNVIAILTQQGLLQQ